MALRIGTGRVFHKAGPEIEKALDPVLVFIRGTTNLFELFSLEDLKIHEKLTCTVLKPIQADNETTEGIECQFLIGQTLVCLHLLRIARR